jgi:hypothetical protein
MSTTAGFIVDRWLLPRDFPTRRRGSCVPAAFVMLAQLDRGAAVSGYVGPKDAPEDEHTWIEVDGEIIDPTIRQFRWWRMDVFVSRREAWRTERAKFLVEFEGVLKKPWTDQGHFYRKFSRWIAQPAVAPSPR